MSDTALNIPFSNDAGVNNTSEKRFVHLEQVMDPGFNPDKLVTMADIAQMVARARTGTSAQSYGYDNCPIRRTSYSIYSTWFNFYVWPSSMSLPHTLTSSIGNVSVPTIVHKQTEFSIEFEMQRAVELDFIMESITSVRWETGCYTAQGELVPDVTLEMDGLSTVVASEEIFGVARIRGIKIGAQHRLTVDLTSSVPTQETTPGAGDGAYQIESDGYSGNYDWVDNMPTLGATLRPQVYTIDFVNTEVFNVSGDITGPLIAGNINNDYHCEYFSIPSAFFNASYTGDNYFRLKVQLDPSIEDNWGYTDVVSWTNQDGDSVAPPQANLNMTGAVITNLNVTVMARWIGFDGEEEVESLKLKVPQCVQDILNMCDPFGDDDGDGIPNYLDPDYGQGGSTLILNPDSSYKLYYSICDGEVLKIVEVEPNG